MLILLRYTEEQVNVRFETGFYVNLTSCDTCRNCNVCNINKEAFTFLQGVEQFSQHV